MRDLKFISVGILIFLSSCRDNKTSDFKKLISDAAVKNYEECINEAQPFGWVCNTEGKPDIKKITKILETSDYQHNADEAYHIEFEFSRAKNPMSIIEGAASISYIEGKWRIVGDYKPSLLFIWKLPNDYEVFIYPPIKESTGISDHRRN